ncbi:kinase-like domain-containing protein [Crassisporium funariophilum]|nr:kinase-like domain-containing protein [Crassisporium funariophilum]
MASSSFLEQYDSLDVIGNGSFGIIRKVRRKTDGLIFARKELNFERMSERDRKQIVSEVNILKDLHHDHIVRYHDRYVDRDAGILYILMEYCGGGDLSTVIKQATKQIRPIPEDTIWNYFLQILLALHHCHHPNGHGRSGSGSASNGGAFESDGNSRRAQILHRDLKPDNVFLDENNTVKLGDFGLSKALAQASFANTYVGTPYYMSPELMQEKAYDSKSDIWSLGCLIYELCALKPPFHEAKTHSELSIFIRNGRIPPLPRGYSQALTSVIKSMLNLNPAMRPSAAQLLQHERLELVHKVADTEKMLSIVKGHRTNLAIKEHEVIAREQALIEKEQHLASLLKHKDQEISALQQLVTQLQQQQHSKQYSHHEVEVAIKQAIGRREEELRVLVKKREEEVAVAMSKREEEIMDAVRRREEEVCDAWVKREEEIRKEVEENFKSVEERIEWVVNKENELKVEESRLVEAREELQENMKKMEKNLAKGRKEKNPLEEVKNLLEPLARMTQATPGHQLRRKLDLHPTPKLKPTAQRIPSLETPITRPAYSDYMHSAMKGVVLTSTGETLATPSPAELVNLFNCSPKVGLNFAKIFDFGDGDRDGPLIEELHVEENEIHSPPPSPSSRKEREKAKEREKERDDVSEASSSSSGAPSTGSKLAPAPAAAPPTRLRRPSIRTSARSNHTRSGTIPSSASELAVFGPTSSSSGSLNQAKPLPHPHLRSSSSNSNLAAAARAAGATLPIQASRTHPSPEYDLNDEENLPSPFLKRTDSRNASAKAPVSAPSPSVSTSARGKRRGSSGLLLRAVAAANSAGRRGSSAGVSPILDGEKDASGGNTPSIVEVASDSARPSLASARKASEEARKALLRP